MIKKVIAIWACHSWTKAFGFKDKLPWKSYKLDLDALDQVLSGADHIIASRKLKSTLPKSFLNKWPNIIECNQEETLERILYRLTGVVVVLGGRTVFMDGIERGLFDLIIEHQLFFPAKTHIEYDTVAPKINFNKYILHQRRPVVDEARAEGMYICYYEKRR